MEVEEVARDDWVLYQYLISLCEHLCECVCMCVCVCVRVMNTLNTVCRCLHVVMGSEPLAPVWNSQAKADCEFVFAYTSTGNHLMASLGACQTHTPAEDMISSQVINIWHIEH